MSITTNVLRVMIAGPADASEAVGVVSQAISDYNTGVEQGGVVLLPMHFTTHVTMGLAAHPQQMLDEQLLAKADLLVAVFSSRLGTPTPDWESGTQQEIEGQSAKGRPTLVFVREGYDGKEPALTRYEEELCQRGILHFYSDFETIRKELSRQFPRIVANDTFIRREIGSDWVEALQQISYYTLTRVWMPFLVITTLATFVKLDDFVFAIQQVIVTFAAFAYASTILPNVVRNLALAFILLILTTALQALIAFPIRFTVYELVHMTSPLRSDSVSNSVIVALTFVASWTTLLPVRYRMRQGSRPEYLLGPLELFRSVPTWTALPTFVLLCLSVLVIATSLYG